MYLRGQKLIYDFLWAKFHWEMLKSKSTTQVPLCLKFLRKKIHNLLNNPGQNVD